MQSTVSRSLKLASTYRALQVFQILKEIILKAATKTKTFRKPIVPRANTSSKSRSGWTCPEMGQTYEEENPNNVKAPVL